MGLRKRWKQVAPYYPLFSLLWAVAVVIAMVVLPASVTAAPKVISAEPYPVGNLRITREKPEPNEYRLTLKNLDITGAESNRARAHTWLLAGARGVTPEVEVLEASYIHLKNGRVTTTTITPPEQVKQNLIRVADLGLFRQYWAYTFTVTSVSPAGQDSFWVLDEATVRVNIGKPTAPVEEIITGRWKAKFGEERLPGSILLNPDIPTDYYAVDYTDPVETWSDWTRRIDMAAKDGGLFRFSVYSGGLYRLSRSDLETSTGATIDTPATTWRVLSNGQELPLITGADDDAADSVFLAVAPTELDGLSEQVFWLDTTGKNAKRQQPLRLAEPALPAGAAADNVTSTGAFSKVHRELADYNPKLKAGPGADRWIWTDLDVDSPEILQLNLPDYFQPLPDSKVRFSIRYGFTNFPPMQPALLLFAGVDEAGQTSLTVQMGTATLDVDADLLKPGNNPIALRLAYPASAESKRPVSIQAIQTDWTQVLPAPASDVVKYSVSSTTTDTQGMEFDGTLPESAVVVGFQNEQPALLATDDNIAYWEKPGFTSFMAADRSAAKPVPVLNHVEKAPLLTGFTSAKSVIISADELASASEALLPMHDARGLSVQLYKTRDIYDAFSYGNPDPAAIRNFLRYLFYKAPGAVPEYVTLVGEASDFRGDPTLVPPSTQLNLLPASASGNPESPQGDQQYSAAIGSDLVSDFMVGRIPAAREQQVSDFIKKMENFQSGSGGDWSRVTEFVMDDNDEFPDVVHRIVSEGMSPSADTRLFRQWDFEYVPNLRVQGKKRSWTATETLIDKFNEGIGVLNFFGHGGPNLWSHERLLHLSDLPEITNALRLPLITCASCDNAWISYPTPPVKASMGEQMVLKRDGGALALFGPVAGASPYEHSTLVQSLMEGITRAQVRTVGDLILYAENMYYGITRSASIPDQYLLLGDPTSQLPMPRTLPLLSGSVVTGEDSSHVLKVVLDQGVQLTTSGTLYFLSGNLEEQLASLEVNAGEREWTLPLPADFPGGAVRVSLEWAADGEQKLAGVTIPVMPPQAPVLPKPVLVSREGSAYDITVPDTGFERMASNTNIYQFNLHATEETTAPVRIVAVGVDGTKLAEAPRVEVTTATEGNRFDLNFTAPLEPPVTTVSLQVLPTEASDTPDDPLTTVTYALPAEGTAQLAFVPGSARAYTADDGEFIAGNTIFLEAEIRNEGAVASSGFTLQALRQDPTTGTELQTINESSSYRVEGLLPGESKVLAFRWENTTPGSYPDLFLSANRNKIVRESTYDDNHIALPTVEVVQSGNFFVSDFSVTPPYAVSGTTVSLYAVLQSIGPSNPRPVTVEAGWGRSFDDETSSSRFPVEIVDGIATVTRELVVPEHFAYGFVKVNADMEIEEALVEDNTTQTDTMIITPLAEADGSPVNLASTIVSGVSYNLDMPFENVMRVTPNFTSTTDYLVVDHPNITTGTAIAADAPNDDAWWVTPWRVAAGAGESPGEIGFRLPLQTVQTDVPGMLTGYFIVQKGATPTVEVKAGESAWRQVTPSGSGPRPAAEFGRLYTENSAISWHMRPAGNSPIVLEYLTFTPHAVEWDSAPYLLPDSMRSQLLELSVETDDPAKWEAMYLEWRAGESRSDGSIDWLSWQSVPGWQAPLSSEEYLQIRILGVPLQNEKPNLLNIRLSKP